MIDVGCNALRCVVVEAVALCEGAAVCEEWSWWWWSHDGVGDGK